MRDRPSPTGRRFWVNGDQPVPLAPGEPPPDGFTALSAEDVVARWPRWTPAVLDRLWNGMYGPDDPGPVGTIEVPRAAGADAAVCLADDPQSPDPWARIALVNLARPGPITPGRLCVIQLPAGPMLRRVTRRGRRLLLRTRTGQYAGSASADVRLIPVLSIMGGSESEAAV
jgi:hypothetical protein